MSSLLVVAIVASTATAIPPAPTPMAGPFPSIVKACRALGYASYPTSSGVDRPPIVCRATPLRLVKAAGPIRAVAAIERDFENGRDARVVHLAIQTDAGWYAARRGVPAEGSGRCVAAIRIDELAVRPLVDGEPARALLRLRTQTDCSGATGTDGEYESRWENRYWLLGGVGASGIPSATPPLLVEQHRKTKETLSARVPKTRVESSDAVLSLRVQPGELAVSGSLDGFADGTDDGWSLPPPLATHRLAFP